MNTLTIKLKQHTPLIHFQHDQEGATLRASEVKPKLDKYILSKLSSEEKSQGKREGWIKAKNGKEWLDYKMRIQNNCKPITSSMENEKGRSLYPSFFGNQNAGPGKIKEIVFVGHFKQDETDVTILILTSYEVLKNKIDCYKDYFFLTNNFGTRQTKGFGSYFLADNAIVDIHDERIKQYYRFKISIPDQDQGWERVFQKLDEHLSFFYKTLRSGINIEPFYFKSLMFFYAIKKEKYYDKRRIREHFSLFTDERAKYSTTIKMKDKGEKYEMAYTYNADDARLYRDMLGLSSSQSWQKYRATISKENDDIARFKSPILLKPFISAKNEKKDGDKTESFIDFIVLVIPSEIPNDYYEQGFIIKKDGNNRTAFELKTPEKGNFSIDEFLKFSLSKTGQGYQKAKEQLDNRDYAQWSNSVIISQREIDILKQKLEKKANKVLTDDEIKEKIKKRKIRNADNISEILKNIYDNIFSPDSLDK